MKKLAFLVTIAPLLAFLAGAPAHARGQPMYTPDPIQVPPGKGVDAVKKAIRKACFDKEWEVREIGAGHIQAMHTKHGRKGKNHVAVVDIRYDAKSVRISYKDSQDLDYDASDKSIHKTYNSWVRYLEKNIRTNLGSF